MFVITHRSIVISAAALFTVLTLTPAAAAQEAGADVVLPRSRFFRDIRAAVAT